jgi:predicted acyl esterase
MRRVQLLTVVAASVVAGLGISGVAAAAAAADSGSIAYGAPSWWNYNRPAKYTTNTTPVYVTMADGTPIFCALHQPAGPPMTVSENGVTETIQGQPAPGKFPGLIEEYDPYGGLGGLGAEPGTDDFWADHGYVSMYCEVRGTGQSGGVWLGLLSEQENLDNYQLLEWMRQQPWSNGRLGQLGGSYGGMTSMRVASLRPPGLKAISPLSSEYDLYDENIYPGGIKTTPGSGDNWPPIALALSGGRENAAYTFAQYMQHPLWDSFWQQISIIPKWRHIKVPVLGLSAYNDTLVPGGAPANWIGLEQAGNRHNYLIVGPWGHDSTSSAQATLPAGAQLAWFDHWVMGIKSAPLPSQPVTSFEQPTKGGACSATCAGQGWESFSSWPPPQDQTENWALNPDNSISQTARPAGTESYTTLPTDNGYSGFSGSYGTRGTVGAGGETAANQQTEVFQTAPLAQPLSLAGTVVVRLRAALSYTDGNFQAMLYDVSPSGTATFLQFGNLKASHRNDVNGTATPVSQGEVATFPIDIFPVHWRFAAGDRLELVIYGGDNTWVAPEPMPVTTTLSLGKDGSSVSLPVLHDS